MKKHFAPVLLLALTTAMTGCALEPLARKEADASYANNDKKIAELNSTVKKQMDESNTLVKSFKGKWIGAKSIPVSSDVVLPEAFYASWGFNFPGRVNIATAAERITMVTGIPVFVKPDAYVPLARFVHGANVSNSTNTTAVAGTLQGQEQMQMLGMAQDGSINGSIASDFSTTMELNFQGTLVDFLNRIASRATLSWEYRDGRIEFYRVTTRTFTLKTTPGDSVYSSKIGKSGSTQAGNQSSGTGSNSASNASFSADSAVTMTTNISVWTSVQTAVSSMLSPLGRMSINQSTGTITVTDSKDVVDVVGKYIENENRTLNRQVRMRVELFNVILSKNYENGADWNVVFSRLNSLLNPDWSLNFATPTSLVGQEAGSLGFKITATGSSGLARWNGTEAMIKALNGIGIGSVSHTTTAVTQNRQPVPVALTEQVSYLAATTPVAAMVGGGTGGVPGLTPGMVTTGYIINLLPTVNDNGSVSVQFSIDMSELKRINTISSGQGANQQSIQAPEVSSTQFQQKITARSGETIILSGFERWNYQYEKRTLTEGGNSWLQGSLSGKGRKEGLVMMITPVIEDN
ncbi:secretin N-terminal domain-containing protein [Methylobacillus sp. Pita2]|uniref:secretin N-terminal domain-containing protein n=1 Tax=Methylobacillus sp. Pita2 TaxID=3383245 RepID=UPI0038B4408A